MKCFYHNDPDGMCAGNCVYRDATLHDLMDNSEYIEIDYSMEFPLNKIKEDEQIYIVDFSIEPDIMTQLLEITKDVTWIDHHITAIEKYNDYPYDIRGVRYSGISGCMLTFIYLNFMTIKGDGEIKPLESFDVDLLEKDAPMYITLINDWDVWNLKYGDKTRAFIVAFNAYDFNPTSSNWKTLDANQMIKDGEIMTIYKDNWSKIYCEQKGFYINFEGYKCYAMNLGICNSDSFKSIPKNTYDILMPFSFDGESWTFSLYSTNVDVSQLAKKYKGGGHTGASGFVLKELPSFILDNKKNK